MLYQFPKKAVFLAAATLGGGQVAWGVLILFVGNGMGMGRGRGSPICELQNESLFIHNG